MPRAKLSPEEREARRKERSQRTFSGANYRHYDPTKDGYGSAKEWARTAGERLDGVTPAALVADDDLRVLGLAAVPTMDDLRRAYRAAARKAHPDVAGGSHEAFLAVQEAFERLSDKLGD